MADKERIIKLVWGVKSMKNTKLKYMEEYTEKEINTLVDKAYKNDKKGKSDKVEVITTIIDSDGGIKYKRYFFDNKNEYTYGDCMVSITAKNKNAAKAMTFEDKLNLLEGWLKKKGVIPKVGDLMNDFDVGKFYQQSVTNVNKLNEVISTVEQYASSTDE